MSHFIFFTYTESSLLYACGCCLLLFGSLLWNNYRYRSEKMEAVQWEAFKVSWWCWGVCRFIQRKSSYFVDEARQILRQGRRCRKVRNLEVQPGFREGTQREVREGWKFVYSRRESYVGLETRRISVRDCSGADRQCTRIDLRCKTFYDLTSGLIILRVLTRCESADRFKLYIDDSLLTLKIEQASREQ